MTRAQRVPSAGPPRYRHVVVERTTPFGGRVAVKLTCGHVFSVRAYSRYHHAKTLGCIKCRAGTPVGSDDIL